MQWKKEIKLAKCQKKLTLVGREPPPTLLEMEIWWGGSFSWELKTRSHENKGDVNPATKTYFYESASPTATKTAIFMSI